MRMSRNHSRIMLKSVLYPLFMAYVLVEEDEEVASQVGTVKMTKA